MLGSTALGRMVVMKSLPNCTRAKSSQDRYEYSQRKSLKDWYPFTPHEARSFRSDSHSKRSMKPSSPIRQATAADGKVPHWLSGPKREEPSRRTLSVSR